MSAKTSSHRALPAHLQVPWGLLEIVIFVGAWIGLQLGLGIGIAVAGLAGFAPAKELLDGIAKGAVGPAFAFDLIGVTAGVAIVWGLLRKYKAGWRDLGWRKFSLGKAVLHVLLILVAFVFIANIALLLVKLLVPGFDPNQAQTNEFTNAIDSNRSLALVALVLLPPIFEETIFRGFIFPALAKRGGMAVGMIASSALFGIAHGQPNLFVYTFILGLLLCWMYAKLGSIVPGIALHMLNNYLAFIALSNK